jgi:hypothetical protein
MKGNRSDEGENRGRQLLAGAGILFALSALVVTFLMGWRYVPGWVGESLGTMAGIMSTPFFMEASFFILGLVIVIGLNTWRRHRAGDEFVTIETNEASKTAKPDDAGHR